VSIIFLRHASLAKDEQKRYYGWSNIEIDEELFDESKIASLKEIEFDFVFSSDLKRCTKTVEKMKLPYVKDRRLREVCFNEDIEGKLFDEIETLSSYSSDYLKSESVWHDYICKESRQEFTSRLKEFLSSLPIDRTILICSHAGAIKEMLKLLGKTVENINYLEYIEVYNELR
jgi:alpha-ribazole phosphatase/probable phosphoglycerate mutase